MARNKKTLIEESAELGEAVDELVEVILSGFESWLNTGKDFVPDYMKVFLSKLKEKGLKIVRED